MKNSLLFFSIILLSHSSFSQCSYVDGWNHQRCMQYLFSQVDLVNTPAATTGTLYKEKLKENYTFVHVNAHSSPTFHALTPSFTSSSIISTNPNTFFYNLIACQNAEFSAANNMGSLYLLGNDYGLGVIGTTKSGSMQHYTEFYKGLSENMSMGRAMKRWWLANVDMTGGNDYFERMWFYGVTLLGDPTLTIKPNFVLEKMNVLDAEADGNLDAGETAELNFTVNHPLAQTSSMEATLSTDDPNITILSKTAIFNTSGGKQLKNSSPFKISLSNLIKDQYTFYLKLQFKNANAIQVKCTAMAPSIYIDSYYCNPYNGGGAYTHEITFTVKNVGHEHARNISLTLPNTSTTVFDQSPLVNQNFSPNEVKTFKILCKSTDASVFIDPQFKGDNFDQKEKVLISLTTNAGKLFDMNTPSLFTTYGLKENWKFNNDWHQSTTDGRNGGSCFHYGTTASGTYRPFAEGALETPFLMINNKVKLKFWHYYVTDNQWDGGVVEGFINGNWKTMNIIGGYPGWACNELLNEYKYHSCFTNSQSNWEEKEIDLSGLYGMVKFRFHFFGEGANHFKGWFIDDINYTYQQTLSTDKQAADHLSSSCYPNPFKDDTRIDYVLDRTAHVNVEIYDITGRKISELVNEMQTPTEHHVIWKPDSNELGEGIYFYKITVDDGITIAVHTSKIVVLK